MRINNGIISLQFDGQSSYNHFNGQIDIEMVVDHPILGKIWIDVLQASLMQLFEKKFSLTKEESFDQYRIKKYDRATLPNGSLFDSIVYCYKDNGSVYKKVFEFLLYKSGYSIYIRNISYSDKIISSDFISFLNNIEIDEKSLLSSKPYGYFNAHRFAYKNRLLLLDYYKNLFNDVFASDVNSCYNHIFCSHVFPVLEGLSLVSKSPIGLLYGNLDTMDGEKRFIRHFDYSDISFWRLPINRPNLWDNPGNGGIQIYIDSNNENFDLPHFDNLFCEISKENCQYQGEFSDYLNNLDLLGGWIGIQPDVELQEFVLFVFSDAKLELMTQFNNLITNSGYCSFSIEDIKKKQYWPPVALVQDCPCPRVVRISSTKSVI